MYKGSPIVICTLIKGGLDQMEPKVKGKFVTSSKVKIFQNPCCHILEKINENYDKKVIWLS